MVATSYYRWFIVKTTKAQNLGMAFPDEFGVSLPLQQRPASQGQEIIETSGMRYAAYTRSYQHLPTRS
jgi:hypothetical protein